ncbi:cytochrome P450 [Zychaea mexicana]|uniref:cytochrome P450 n=1 Tax=Zychaea mexicana TaxID=64656 RepID=UPI0022FE5303|nr:cytochrome P450 [Zychaea mexicana]KAI9495238.1 cytochrome P450 [Zychaea mexicana]
MTAATDSLFSKQTAILGGGSAIALVAGLLALKYNDRPLFAEERNDMTLFRGHPLIGSLLYMIRNKARLVDYISDEFESNDVTTLMLQIAGRPPRVLTIDPDSVEHMMKVNFSNYPKSLLLKHSFEDLLGDGIFASNGQTWKYQRKTASHVFNVANFRHLFTDVFLNKLDVVTRQIFDRSADTKEPVDFHDIILRFTLDSFVLLGFGVELHALTNKEGVPFATSFDICQQNCFDRLHSPTTRIWEALQPILSPRQVSIGQHYKTIKNFSLKIIRERRKLVEEGGKEFNDMLYRFMVTPDPNGKILEDRELAHTILNFIIAGRDTTAQALSWTFYNLMLYPRVEAKLLAEIEAHWPNEKTMDSSALYEIVKSLTYAHAVLFETLRLYPSVPIASKHALEDDVWPDGTCVKKGDTVGWCPYAQGRSKRVWGNDARMFKPERWIDNDGNLVRESQGKWPAFNGGPRVCLGQNLAILEAIVAIATLLQRYKFSLVPGQEITYTASLTLPMKNGMRVWATRR